MIWWVFALMLGAVALDQLTKWLAVAYLTPGESLPIWQDVLHLTYYENPGAAFGILTEHRWVFMIISTVAILALSYYIIRYRPQNFWVKLSLGMIVGGGIGNMIDRTILGYVIDFIDFCLIDFAIFNVADSFVTVGAGIMIVYLIKDLVRESRKDAKEKETADETSELTPSAPTEEARENDEEEGTEGK